MKSNQSYFVYPDYFYNPYGYVFSGYTNNGAVSEQTGTIFIEESRANNHVFGVSPNKKTSEKKHSQKQNKAQRKPDNQNGNGGEYALNGRTPYVPAYPY